MVLLRSEGATEPAERLAREESNGGSYRRRRTEDEMAKETLSEQIGNFLPPDSLMPDSLIQRVAERKTILLPRRTQLRENRLIFGIVIQRKSCAAKGYRSVAAGVNKASTKGSTKASTTGSTKASTRESNYRVRPLTSQARRPFLALASSAAVRCSRQLGSLRLLL